jgi:hypothetical protein
VSTHVHRIQAASVASSVACTCCTRLLISASFAPLCSWALGEAFAPERCAELAADAPCCVSALLRVRRCDLDMNRHVNNASYLRWILEDVPSHVCEGAFACGVDIEYRAECGYGDEVVSRSELRRADGQCLAGADGDVGVGGFTLQHALLRTRDKAELLRARTHWRPLPPPA